MKETDAPQGLMHRQFWLKMSRSLDQFFFFFSLLSLSYLFSNSCAAQISLTNSSRSTLVSTEEVAATFGKK